jgi:hypothetical protein
MSIYVDRVFMGAERQCRQCLRTQSPPSYPDLTPEQKEKIPNFYSYIGMLGEGSTARAVEPMPWLQM